MQNLIRVREIDTSLLVIYARACIHYMYTHTNNKYTRVCVCASYSYSHVFLSSAKSAYLQTC